MTVCPSHWDNLGRWLRLLKHISIETMGKKIHVIFHKRVRVFYQGFQTHESNRIHELFTKGRLLFFRACKARKTMKITRPFRPSDFYCLECFTSSEEQWTSRGKQSSVFYCSQVFGNPGKTQATSLWNNFSIVYCLNGTP